MMSLDEYEQRCLRTIEKFGFMVQQVGGNGWAYTVGLTPTLGYELISVGLPPEASYATLNTLAVLLKAGDIPDDQPIAKVATLPVMLRTIELAADPDVSILLGTARRLNILPPRLRQMVWPDPQGNFPGSPEYAYPNSQDVRAIAADEVRIRYEMEERARNHH